MYNFQVAILASLPRCGLYLSFSLASNSAPGAADVRATLARITYDEARVVGIGDAVVQACDGTIAGIRSFTGMTHGVLAAPSTQDDLWIWLSGNDRGALTLEARQLISDLKPVFEPHLRADAFLYREGRDLSGYVDGTENPQGNDARRTAILHGTDSHLDGSSFVAVQQWVHDLSSFEAHSQRQRDHIIGRTQKGDIELEDAPESAHVKRTAQESFTPDAFMVRRSMPWSEKDRMGLMFVAFSCSFDAFEAQLRRMLGMEDEIPDALFSFTQPISGAYYWCPPVHNGALDWRALGA